MTIQIKRNLVKDEVTQGKLYIDDIFICDTLENSRSCLDAGFYALRITKCKQHRRNVICVESLGDEVTQNAKCHKCKLKELVFNNTVMPQFCPQIKAGNGVYGRHDGSIVVGTLAAPGCIISPRSAFDLLYERIRKNIERGKRVELEICSFYDGSYRELTGDNGS